jgi:hypothetical protein
MPGLRPCELRVVKLAAAICMVAVDIAVRVSPAVADGRGRRVAAGSPGGPPVAGGASVVVVASPDLPGGAGRGASASTPASRRGPLMRSGQSVTAGPRVGRRARRVVGTLSECRLAGVAPGLGVDPAGMCGLGTQLFDDACSAVGSTTAAPRHWRAPVCPAAETRRPWPNAGAGSAAAWREPAPQATWSAACRSGGLAGTSVRCRSGGTGAETGRSVQGAGRPHEQRRQNVRQRRRWIEHTGAGIVRRRVVTGLA